MKNHILPATLLTLCCIVFFSGVYTVVVWGVAQFAPNRGKGEVISYSKDNASKYGFTNVGQSFTNDKYFWSRPSAVNYNAASSAGSNKGPSNPGLPRTSPGQDRYVPLAQPRHRKSKDPCRPGHCIGKRVGSSYFLAGGVHTDTPYCQAARHFRGKGDGIGK